MSKLKVFHSNSTNPWFNLATEDWIFRDMDPQIPILFLWRNAPTVVIGRFQNPWAECDLDKMKQDQVKLTRRQSGGGAVYHDLNNSCFTFMSSKEDYSQKINNQILVNALSKFDIKAIPSGRNDILVGDRKVSGSAFKETKDRKFHHGTMLLKTDLSKLASYLKPKKKKLESKGINSVRSRVANLTEFYPDLDHEKLCLSIKESFIQYYQKDATEIYLDEKELAKISKLNNYYEFLSNWNWRFGETPKFTHHLENHFPWGGVDVHLNSHKGMITKSVIFSDSLHPEMVEFLAKSLEGIRYQKDEIFKNLQQAIDGLPMYEQEISEFRNWLVSEV